MHEIVVVVWLGTAAARAEHARDLQSWARSRMTTLVDPPVVPETASAYRAEVVESIETALTEGRTALDASETESAKAKLDEAERLLFDNASLPQAAWLMAEVSLLQARFYDPNDPTRAERARQRARTLSGQREASFAQEGAVDPQASASRSAETLELSGTRPTDRVYVDAVERRRPVTVSPELHHVRVLRDGAAVFSAWVAPPPGGTLRIVPRSASPCSQRDLGQPTIRQDRVIAASGTRCERWIVARPAPDGIAIATCFQARCGRFTEWKSRFGAPPEKQAPESNDSSDWPPWLTWTLAGAAVVATGSFVAWQVGAFDEPRREPARVEFVPPPR